MCKLKLILVYFLLIVISSNAQWIQLNSGTGLNLNSVYFMNKNLGWVCGDEGIVLRTTDGGDSWIQTTPSNLFNFRTIVFLDSLTGLVAGSKASIYKTTNGGISWSLKNLNPDINLNDIKYIATSTVLAVGDEGLMLLSTDQGNNWVDISDQNQNNLINISFLNDNYGWIGGDDCIKITTNGGNSWANHYFSNEHDNYVFIYSENLIFRTWFEWWGPYLLDPGVHIQKSTNLGNSWTEIYSHISTSNSVYFCSILTGYALTDHSPFIYTTNGGEDWAEFDFVSSSLNAFYFIDCNNGWLVGDEGYISKTNNGGGIFTSVVQESEQISNAFSLLQNYPNPFNPTTHIRFRIPKTEFVTLKVYGILGKEVTTLVNEEKPAGSYTIEFNGSNLASGIYFYQLKAGTYSATKKLILLK